jgi:hypothetical protein
LLCGHPGSALDSASPIVIQMEQQGLIRNYNTKYYLTPVGWRVAMTPSYLMS